MRGLDVRRLPDQQLNQGAGILWDQAHQVMRVLEAARQVRDRQIQCKISP